MTKVGTGESGDRKAYTAGVEAAQAALISGGMTNCDFALVFATVGYDQKELLIAENPEMGFAESPALWSDNPGLIYLAKDHFERAWNKGRKYQYNEKKKSTNTIDQI